jgi:hypothetical protein
VAWRLATHACDGDVSGTKVNPTFSSTP